MFCECVDYGSKREEILRYWIHKSAFVNAQTGVISSVSTTSMDYYVDICMNCDREINPDEEEDEENGETKD